MSDTATAAKTDPKTDTKPTNAAPAATENGEKGKPGRKPGQKVVRPDTSTFNLDAIAAAEAAPAFIVNEAAPKLERKPEQLAMDKVAERAHAAWVKAGRPAAWPKMPVITYYLDPTQVEGYKYLIRRACDFHGTRPRFGSPVRLTVEMARKLGRADTDAGREVLAWAVLDKRPKSTKGDETKTDNPAAARADAAK